MLLPPRISPDQVAIVYSMGSKDSQALAVNYARRAQDSFQPISSPWIFPILKKSARSVFESKIRQPLVAHFDREIWWNRATDNQVSSKVPDSQ